LYFITSVKINAFNDKKFYYFFKKRRCIKFKTNKKLISFKIQQLFRKEININMNLIYNSTDSINNSILLNQKFNNSNFISKAKIFVDLYILTIRTICVFTILINIIIFNNIKIMKNTVVIDWHNHLNIFYIFN
jgi:hypothetical protein